MQGEQEGPLWPGWGDGEGNKWEDLFVFKTGIKEAYVLSTLQFFLARACIAKVSLNTSMPLSNQIYIIPKFEGHFTNHSV